MQASRSFLLLALAASAALAGCAGHHTMMGAGPAQASAVTPASRLAVPDVGFATVAAGTGLYEVEASRIALGKAVSAPVRDYAQMMVAHHTASNNELMALLRAKGVTPPTVMPSDKQAKITQLSRLAGAEFDREYIRMVGVQDHQAAIAQFEQGARTVADADLRAWIAKTLPTLQAHLQQAQGIAGRIAG